MNIFYVISAQHPHTLLDIFYAVVKKFAQHLPKVADIFYINVNCSAQHLPAAHSIYFYVIAKTYLFSIPAYGA